MSDLIDHLIGVGDDSMKLFKSLQAFIVVAKPLIYETQVINGFDAVSFDTDSFKEEFLCSIVVLVDKQTVALIDKGL